MFHIPDGKNPSVLKPNVILYLLKVYVVGSESGQVEWLTTGPQLGAGFGLAVAAGDVTGDGVDELFVGAPLFGEHRSCC